MAASVGWAAGLHGHLGASTDVVEIRVLVEVTYETDATARKPRSEDARGLTTVLVGEAWDYMEQVHIHMCVICAY